jgi:hypothetical protein
MTPVISPPGSDTQIQNALAALGTPNGFIAYDVIPLLQQAVVLAANLI